MNLAGAHRHSSNFNKIITALSAHLKLSGMGTIKDREETFIQRPPPPRPAETPIASGSRAPNPSAPMVGGPKAGKFKLPVTWIVLGSVVVLVLVVVLDLAMSAVPHEDSKPVKRSIDDSKSAESTINDNLSASDFQIVSTRGEWISGGLYAIGEVRNNGHVAAGVQVQAIARDNAGQLVDSGKFWPNSINNIPPGASVGVRWNVTSNKSAVRVELQILSVEIW